MRLEDMLKDISGITNKVVKTNCFEGQNTLLDSILLIQTKVNEVIQAINDGIIKGDKGDTPNVQVGVTETLDPNSVASVTQTGDILNPIFNFGIPKGEKGEKGDTGKASESIQDDVISLDTTWSSTKIDSLFKNIDDTQGLEYITENNFYSINGSKNGVITDIKLEGKTLVVDSNNQVVLPGTQGAILKSVGDDVSEIKLKSIDGTKNIFDGILQYGSLDSTGNLVVTNTKKVSNFIDVNPQITFKTNVDVVCCYDINKNFINRFVGLSAFITPSNCRYIRFRTHDIGTPQYLNNYYVSITGSYNYIGDSKKVLYKDTDGTWKKPTLRQWDSIEKHSDGKYYYHKRSIEKILNGTESWSLVSSLTMNNTMFFSLDTGDIKNNNDILAIKSDKFGTIQMSNLDQEGIRNNNLVQIRILKSKLSTQDLQGFKNWLNLNNVTVVYPIKNEQIFECTPIDLISYDTQTNYSIECGHIYPKSTLYINSDYGNVLSNIIRRITQIEEDRIEDRKALIRGDFKLLAEKTYPSDFIKREVLPNE